MNSLSKINDGTLKAELSQLRLRVQNCAAAEYLWRSLLSPDEKKRLGNNLNEAYCHGGTLGMWMRLHGGDAPQALLNVAYEIGLLSEPMHKALLRRLGISGPPKVRDQTPEWDKEARELRFAGKVIRRVLRPRAAKNVVRVLDEFQRQRWPPRIDDPLPDKRNQQRLHATIRSLNSGLKRIRIKADGTGAGYIWHKV